MPLRGTVQRAPSGAQGFDTDAVLTAAQAANARKMGFTFCLRYISRSRTGQKGDLTAVEAKRILDAGLSLMAVQHVAKEGWSPTVGMGTECGQAAVANLQAAGFPAGPNVWLDLEGILHSTSGEDVVAYSNAWFAEVTSAGFLPGVYVGANAILTGDDMYWRLIAKSYWRSGSKVDDIPHRSYQMFQRIVSGDRPFGVEIDRNVTKDDGFGDAVMWLSPIETVLTPDIA